LRLGRVAFADVTSPYTQAMTEPINRSLAETDPLIAEAIDHEVARQANGLELIA